MTTTEFMIKRLENVKLNILIDILPTQIKLEEKYIKGNHFDIKIWRASYIFH